MIIIKLQIEFGYMEKKLMYILIGSDNFGYHEKHDSISGVY